MSPHIALHESGLPFQIARVDLKSHKLEDGSDFYLVNPLGYVPLLELKDGTRLSEGAAIVQYIADQAPDKKLAPANGTLPRYQLQRWLGILGTEIHKGYSPLFNPGTPEPYKAMAKEKLHSRLQWIDGQLASQPYLMGDHYTVADGYLFTTTNWSAKVGPDISALRHLQAYRTRIAERPAVKAAMKAEGLI